LAQALLESAAVWVPGWEAPPAVRSIGFLQARLPYQYFLTPTTFSGQAIVGTSSQFGECLLGSTLALSLIDDFRARLLLIYDSWAFTMSLRAETQFESACGRLAKARGGMPNACMNVQDGLGTHDARQPEFATMVGFPGQNDRWSDLSMEAIQRRKEELKGPIRVIKSIDARNSTRLIS